MSTSLFSIKDVLREVKKDSCPYRYNFHCHTTCSDGSLSPIDLLNQASSLGIKHIAITDHHNVQSNRIIDSWKLSNNISDEHIVKLWSGIEISCLLKQCLVHIIGLDFDINSNHIYRYTLGESQVGEFLKAEVVIDSIHQAGGIAILAHPARYRINFNELIEEAFNLNVDGAEAWYDYELKPIWSATPIICDLIDTKLKSLGLLSSCGTDTHGNSLKGR